MLGFFELKLDLLIPLFEFSAILNFLAKCMGPSFYFTFLVLSFGRTGAKNPLFIEKLRSSLNLLEYLPRITDECSA